MKQINTNSTERAIYETPTVTTMDITSEGVLCASTQEFDDEKEYGIF
ncbi:MAG: hypothetical protein ACI3ZS_09140 [Candidatus Cryptobacteroides sp.]